MEPLSVGVHSVRTLGQLKANQTVAVFGAGPVGLLALAVAKALGAKRTIAVDIDQNRLNFAKSYAATDVWLPPKKNEGESMIDYSKRNAEEMKAKLGLTDRGPTSVDLIIEASGAAVCVQSGLFLVRTGGTFIQVRWKSDSPSEISLTLWMRSRSRSAWALQRSLSRSPCSLSRS